MRTVIARVSMAVSLLLAPFAVAQLPPERVLGLMKSVVIPASDAVFSVSKAAPKNNREWAAVEAGAAKLIDAAQALATETPATGGADWIRYSNAMFNAATVAGKAAKKKNVDAVRDAADALYTTCESCHRQYVKK